MRQRTISKTKGQVIEGFCYNCVYSLIAAACCAIALDTHQAGKLKEIRAVSPTEAMVTGGFCTFFCVLGLFFLWRQWWRDAQTVRWRKTD